MTSGSCSTTRMVFPRSRRSCRILIRRWVSRLCRPIDGSSSTYKRPYQPRPQGSRQLDALGFAAGESRSQPVQGQVFQPDVNQKLQTLVDFLQQLLRDRGLPDRSV